VSREQQRDAGIASEEDKEEEEEEKMEAPPIRCSGAVIATRLIVRTKRKKKKCKETGLINKSSRLCLSRTKSMESPGAWRQQGATQQSDVEVTEGGVVRVRRRVAGQRVEQAVAHAAAAVAEDEAGRYEAALEEYLAAAELLLHASLGSPLHLQEQPILFISLHYITSSFSILISFIH
jgi:hypothetical protein